MDYDEEKQTMRVCSVNFSPIDGTTILPLPPAAGAFSAFVRQATNDILPGGGGDLEVLISVGSTTLHTLLHYVTLQFILLLLHVAQV